MPAVDGSLLVRVFVTGVPRSGTTVVARMLPLDFGRDAFGLMEDAPMREFGIKRMLHMIGMDERGQDPIPPPYVGADDWVLEGLKRLCPPAYKDCKAALLWTVLHRAFPEAKWVIVRRDTWEIAQSCRRTGFMNAFNNVKAWHEWANEYSRRLDTMSRHVDGCEIWPHHFIRDGDDSEFEQLCAWLGVEWDRERAGKMIDGRRFKAA